MTEQTQEQIGAVPSPEALPEKPVTPEQAPESAVSPETKPETPPVPEQPVPAPAGVEVAPGPTAEKSEVHKKIDGILAEDIGDIYGALTPARQAQFRVEGESITADLEQLLAKPKPDVHKMQKLIHGWLFSLAGQSKAFLEKEEIIKLRAILNLKEA